MRRNLGSIVRMGSWLALGAWVASASLATAENCERFFPDGRRYKCHYVFEQDGTQDACVETNKPGEFSNDFDAFANTFLVGCECRPTGTVADPDFDASSDSFHCAGISNIGTSFSSGRVGLDAHGRVITHGQGLSSGFGQFTFRCVQDQHCTEPD